MIGLETYDNKTKDNWRRWQRNVVVDLVKGKTGTRKCLKNATVLYLCGPEDLDRELYRDAGFHESNIIAVDIVGGNVSAVRSNKQLAIKADIVNLLMQWPIDWPIHAVVADLCCGFEATAMAIMAALFLSPAVASSKRVAFAINLQRGRDKFSNEIRQTILDCTKNNAPALSSLYQIKGAAAFDCLAGDELNRSKLFYELLVQLYGRCFVKKSNMPYAEEATLAFNRILCPAYFYSYKSRKSNRITMDSMVMQFFRPPVDILCPTTRLLFEEILTNRDPSGNIRAKIAALRAVRTMRQKALTLGITDDTGWVEPSE